MYSQVQEEGLTGRSRSGTPRIGYDCRMKSSNRSASACTMACGRGYDGIVSQVIYLPRRSGSSPGTFSVSLRVLC